MNCPSCTSVNLAVSHRAGVEIDYCPNCRGVWLDRGELDKVLAREAASADRDDDDDHEERDPSGRRGGGRRSWWTELFD